MKRVKRIAKRIAKWGLPVLAVVFLGAQFVPVDRTNPAVEEEVVAPAQVHSVLKRACYDCHSNETVWPWYSRIAPVSWLVAKDVTEGREALNFSTWNRIGAEEQSEAILASWEEVAEGEMPPSIYLPPHPEARLSEADRAILQQWSQTAVAQGEFENEPEDD